MQIINFNYLNYTKIEYKARTAPGKSADAHVGTGQNQTGPVKRVVGEELLGTLRFDNGDGNGNLRSLGRGSLCDVGVPTKIE